MNRRKPSITSLVAFALIVSPVLYVLSYAPVVRFCGEADPDLDIPFQSGSFAPSYDDYLDRPLADSSRYPAYKPADWLNDNTPLRRPLFFWAEMWGVRDAFENGNVIRTAIRYYDSEPVELRTPQTVHQAE